MPTNKKYISDFYPNHYLHIIGRAAGDNMLFRSDENKIYFLKKYMMYSQRYFDTYAYCLLDNHIHFLIKCTDDILLKKYLEALPANELKLHQRKFLSDEINYSESCEFQFKDFFISYAMAYNKMFGRKGSLFINPFRRILIDDEAHFTRLIVYIHANVLKHGLMKDFKNYRWTSYTAILSDKPTAVKRCEVIDWFGGKQKFVTDHDELSKCYEEHLYAME